MEAFAFDRARLAKFARVGERARERDPRWVRPSPASLERQFDRQHPMWRVCQHVLLTDGDARVVALVNPRLAEADGTPYGQLGWFEATGEAAARRVLDAGLAWLAERGCRTALGPMHGSTWHAYRFVTDWGDGVPFLLEPSNPASYPRWWQAHGFTETAAGYSSSLQDNGAAQAKLAPARRAAEEQGYRVEHAALDDLPAVLRRMFDISRAVFRDNPFYSDIEWDEFAALYEGAARLLDPSLVHWLRAPDGEVVGFGFGLRDRFAAARRAGGRGGVAGLLRFATAPRPTRSIFKSMGILGAHQGKGLAAALFHEQAVQSLALGCQGGVRALMADGNRSFATGRELHGVCRRYALFTRAVT